MNRYGRHGTRAWLRRYLRRREQLLQASNALVIAKPFISDRVLHITVPAGVERVIIMMIGNPDDFDETSIPENVYHLPPPVVDAHQDSKEIQAVKQGASFRVSNFLDETKSKYGNTSVFIPNEDIDKIARRALRDERERFPRDIIIDRNIFDQTFMEEFSRLVEEHKKAHPLTFLTERQWNICETARNDKEKAPPDWERVGDYHRRDLAILNAVKYLGIRPETETDRAQLKSVHDWADEYDLFYQEKRKGVLWENDPSDFR